MDASSQREFSDLEMPKQFPRMQHLALHPAFSGSSGSIKSNAEIDSSAPLSREVDAPILQEGICDEALSFIRKWELKMQDSSDSIGGPRYVLIESLQPVDCTKPPRRFWRTSWKCMAKKLIDSSVLES
jgi:hypothetical protein